MCFEWKLNRALGERMFVGGELWDEGREWHINWHHKNEKQPALNGRPSQGKGTAYRKAWKLEFGLCKELKNGHSVGKT